jgi:hypothetical protein
MYLIIKHLKQVMRTIRSAWSSEASLEFIGNYKKDNEKLSIRFSHYQDADAI